MILMALFRPNQHFTQMQTPIRRARGLLYLFLYITKLPTTRVSRADQKLLNAFKAPWLSLKMTDYSTLQLDFSIVFYISFELREKSLEVPPFVCVCVVFRKSSSDCFALPFRDCAYKQANRWQTFKFCCTHCIA